MTSPLRVAVFAYNEERNIVRCLESVRRATRRPEDLRATVLINGCRDRTEERVREYATRNPFVEPVAIPVGDKANAWNTYVYSGLDFAANHYFLDGDTWLPPFTLDVLEEEFYPDHVLAVAPLPIGVSESLRELLTRYVMICGTLYGVRGDFLRRVVEGGIRLPVGLIGDDSLVNSLLTANLSDRFEDWNPRRVRIVEHVGPAIPRPSGLSWQALRLQYRRLRRYALREVQMQLVNHHVRTHGLRTLPPRIEQLYRYWRAPGLRYYLRPRGLQTPFYWLAGLRAMRGAT